MARRPKREEHENHERWLISYADFITLMFAFFVVMYSISQVNENKYKTFSDAMNDIFSAKEKTKEPEPSPQERVFKAIVIKRDVRMIEEQRRIQAKMKDLAAGLTQVMSPLIEKGQVGVTQSKRGVTIYLSASMLFRSGEATLQPGSLGVLRQVSAILGKQEEAVEVEGHTDDVPIENKQFPSNWELSSARACSVVRLLLENGVPEKRLSAVGLASRQPLLPNTSAENRAKNRRVTITILSPEIAHANPNGEKALE